MQLVLHCLNLAHKPSEVFRNFGSYEGALQLEVRGSGVPIEPSLNPPTGACPLHLHHRQRAAESAEADCDAKSPARSARGVREAGDAQRAPAAACARPPPPLVTSVTLSGATGA